MITRIHAITGSCINARTGSKITKLISAGGAFRVGNIFFLNWPGQEKMRGQSPHFLLTDIACYRFQSTT